MNSVVVVGAFLLFLSFLFFYARKKQQAKLEALKSLASYFAVSIAKFSIFPLLNGVYQGLKFNILLIPEGDGTPSNLMIPMFKKATFKLSLYKESALSELGKKIGVVREVKVFDETFDKEFLIFSNRSERAISYFSNSEIKNAARELFALGFNSLIIDDKGLKIQKTNYNLNIDIEPSRMTSVIQKLSILARGCN